MATTSAKFTASASIAAPYSLSGVTVSPKKVKEVAFTGGTTTPNHADVHYVVSGSVASGTPVTIDLSGGTAKMADGTTATFAHIGGYLIINTTTSGTSTLTAGGGTNAVFSALPALDPGAFHEFATPGTGIAVTASTADILTLTSSSGTVTYDVLLIGRSV